MPGQSYNESMQEIYLFETSQNIEQLEALIIACEKTSFFSQNAINEIFRIMHTIKGSSAMMLFNDIAALAHAMEDLVYFLREKSPQSLDYSILSDWVLQCVDYMRIELHKIRNGLSADGDCTALAAGIRQFLLQIKQTHSVDMNNGETAEASDQHYYIMPETVGVSLRNNLFKANIIFETGCEMENIRAYAIAHNLKDIADIVAYFPEDIIDNDDTALVIREQGFTVYLKTDKSYQEMYEFFMQTVFMKDLELRQLEDDTDIAGLFKNTLNRDRNRAVKKPDILQKENTEQQEREIQGTVQQSIISVSVQKLDKLMDLVGEMVIAEAMVTQNPDLKGQEIDNFRKAARQLHKITNEIQDMVMSVRMVPLSTTFHKMNRIVRDMSKKLGKEVNLQLIGEETEVDKNIIEHISDPLMHLIRNSIDHGIGSAEERTALGKPEYGTVTLEAKNAGSDVLIVVKDDGKGLNKQKILQRARENSLLSKDESEMTDKDIYSLIFLPGFSTKDNVTEFSGRGVGMDVVTMNLEEIGGTVAVESTENMGTTFTMKIPLTLAIIDGMNIGVGNSRYTIPTIAIKESFRPRQAEVITDPDGNEMIMVRGDCYPILRLHSHFGVKSEITDFTEGILIMVEQDGKSCCLFADHLLGQQQVVVKALPKYIRGTKKIRGLAGCTLLGDGNISLILDVGGLINGKEQ